MPEQNPKNYATIFTIHVNSSLPKINESPVDCQDSTAIDLAKQRFCISDGATQSFYSNLWSKILCEEYCSFTEDINRANWHEWLMLAQQRWLQHVIDKCRSLQAERKASWIECSNGISLKKPAFATFLGFTIKDNYIQGIAVGDSFALDIELINQAKLDLAANAARINRIIPSLWNPSFSNLTECLSSYYTESPCHPEFFEIPIKTNKQSSLILMMTDALAAYTLDSEKIGNSILPKLVNITSANDFKILVNELRSNGLANDDTTLLSIEIGKKSVLQDPTEQAQKIDIVSSQETRNLRLLLPAKDVDSSRILSDDDAMIILDAENISSHQDLTNTNKFANSNTKLLALLNPPKEPLESPVKIPVRAQKYKLTQGIDSQWRMAFQSIFRQIRDFCWW